MSPEFMHTVTIYSDGELRSFLNCEAPEHSLCHARWTCGCDYWESEGVATRPWHDSVYEEDRCWGYFDKDYCNLEEWYANQDTPLFNSVTIPVTSRWEPMLDTVEFYFEGDVIYED